MTFLLPRTTTTLGIGLGLTLSTLHPSSPFRSHPLQCQYTAPYARTDSPIGADTHWGLDNDPLIQKQGTTSRHRSTARTMRQVSLGSVLGLLVGVGLRAFSRALVVLLGLGVVAVEWAAANGYNILPLNTLQRYVKSVDLHKAMREQMPFKMSFGSMMALAAFAQF